MISKEYILAEIRRTASENRGTPLGAGRFSAATGIKTNDWLGKHWARWGDALTEAGFEPNQLTVPYTEEFLCEKLIGLCRKLGHFPTRVEIQLEHRVDSTFPTVNVFQRRGRKHTIAENLAQYCKDRNDLVDVAAMCTLVIDHADEMSNAKERDVAAEPEFGHVYLLKSGKFYKIGRSNSVGRRERELAIQLPEKATLVHSITTDDPVGIEQYWHQRFSPLRANGEWFALQPEHVSAFKRRKFM